MQDKEIREQKAKVSRKWYLLFSGILLLLAFGPYIGVVHLTTIDRLTPAVLGVAIILGSGSLIACARGYFRSVENSSGRTYWKPELRRESYGLWIIMGIGASAVVGLLAAAMCVFFLGLLVPYVPGKEVVFHAVVVNLKTPASRRRPCDLEFSREGTNEGKMVCYEPMIGPPLGPTDLQTDERVDVSAHVTAFGTAVVAVQRRSAEGL